MIILFLFLQTPLTITNNKKVISENDKCDMNPKKKLEDKHKEKTVKSNAGVSSRPLGYPLRGDVCHDGVLDIVRLAIRFEHCTDIEVSMGPHWDGDPWIEHINKENVLEVLNGQWLSSSIICFYIRYGTQLISQFCKKILMHFFLFCRYLCEVYLSKNPDLAAKFSFVSPHIVSPLVDQSDNSLVKCLLGHINEDHLVLLPYNVS